MTSEASDYDTWLYSHTPSQAEGERDEPAERAAMKHPDVPRTEPSQAEGERVDDIDSA
ncbi:hypothetical protein GCM10011579_063720 [Streptomyces albiflavescens]|uniref:Uncharacterized protein n=1 Tax=Streptomyces albiflavescens TaxID=1623582 RepID=A0A918D763_9ACTN|nr:hypothetical protein [Streptomyces albiflavescens]GGN79359.1 hypothetical protein GCM10011579_063720 [Streptomyces albiflavescens]